MEIKDKEMITAYNFSNSISFYLIHNKIKILIIDYIYHSKSHFVFIFFFSNFNNNYNLINYIILLIARN